MRELSTFYFFIYSVGPGRDMVGSINWCFGGVGTALAVVLHILDVGGVVRYVFLLTLYVECTLLVNLCSLIRHSFVIFVGTNHVGPS
jgi:hypothetical protein